MVCESIVQPESDKRLYRMVELENELRVLLISDPEMANQPATPAMEADEEEGEDGEEGEEGEEDGEEDEEDEDEGEGEEDDDEKEAGSGDSGKKASCAVAIGVGYLSDPADLGGLAHFAEHMLFMGTEKFPDENGWGAYLSARGGSDNGETDAEHTVFYFDVQPSDLRESMERFGQFFEVRSSPQEPYARCMVHGICMVACMVGVHGRRACMVHA